MADHILIPVSEDWNSTSSRAISLQGSPYRHFISEEAFRERVKLNREILKSSPAKVDSSAMASDVKVQPKEDRSRDSITEYLAWLNATIRLMAAKQSVAFTRSVEQEYLARASGDKPQYDDLASFPGEADEANLALLKTLPGVSLVLPTRGDISVFAALCSRATSLERTVQGMMQSRPNLTVTSVNALKKKTTLHPALPLPLGERSYTAQRRFQVSTLVNNLFGETSNPSRPVRQNTLPVSYDGKSEPISLPEELVPVAYVSSASLVSPPANFSGKSKSLLAQKFAAEDADMDPDVSHLPKDGLFGTGNASEQSAQLPSNPHFDYRIMHGQALRTRAKAIFPASIHTELPSSMTWCARHRVQQCSTCSRLYTGSSTSPVDKAELSVVASQRRQSLAALIPEFLTLSSALFIDLAQDSIGPLSPETNAAPLPSTSTNPATDYSEVDKRTFCASPAWYKLLAALVTQACLDGFLIHGWTGIEAIDVILGVGCGGWDGRTWNRRRVIVMSKSSRTSRSTSVVSDDEDTESDDEKEQDASDRLVEAAQMLFSVRSAAQAEFEREMRERKHEFLDIPESMSLADHLSSLSVKYSLSNFQSLACQFFQAVDTMLGQPSLVSTYLKGQTLSASPNINRRNSIHNAQAMSSFMTRFYAEQRHSLVESLSESRPTTKRKLSASASENLPRSQISKVDS